MRSACSSPRRSCTGTRPGGCPGRPGHVRLVTGNAFDSIGAGAAGMRTAWVNRSAAPFDTIGAQPDLTVPALDRLPEVLAD